MRDLFEMIFCLPTKSFTLVAVLLGFILIDDLSALEQNSLGNFLQLIGQFLETSSAQQQLINSRCQSSQISELEQEFAKLKEEFMSIKKNI